MKVAHLSSVHARNDIRIFWKQCRSIAAHGYNVFLVLADGGGSLTLEGIHVIDVGRSQGRINRMLRTTGRILEEAKKLDAAIYHIHSPELIFAGLRLKAMGKKVIFDAHEDLPKQIMQKNYIHPNARGIVSFLAALIQRACFPWFDALVTATPDIDKALSRHNACTVNVNNFPILGELAPPCRQATSRNNTVCYIGGMSRIRGLVEIVNAIAMVPGDVRLDLAGSFSRTEFETELRSLSGWKRVNWHGWLDRDGVRKILTNARIGLVTIYPEPNHIKSLPNKMFEYMSAGLPVIASDFPLWLHIIEETGCGYCVDPTDPEAIARAINQLINDPRQAHQMGEAGARAVQETYNWTMEERKLINLYESIRKSISVFENN